MVPLSRRSFLFAAAAVPVLAVEIPRPSPDFSINLPDGGKLPLKAYRGKVVGLAFISTMCPHCQKLTVALNDVQKQYGPRGVQILVSAMEANGSQVPGFIQRFRPEYPVGWNDIVSVLTYLQKPVVAAGWVPKMVFIDRSGVIRAQHLAGEEKPDFFETPGVTVRAVLDQMLKAPAPRTRKKK